MLISVLVATHALVAWQSPVRRITTRRHKIVTYSELVDNEADDEATWAWTRRTMAFIAALGVGETAYLTSQKLVGASAICAADCSSVLTGPYSSIGGVPISALGLLGYGTVLGLCVMDDKKYRTPLIVATAAMATFSAWLIALLVLKLQAFCGFCFASAVMSWSNFALAQRTSDNTGATVGSMAAATFAALLTFYFVETGIAIDEAKRSMAALVAGNEASLVMEKKATLLEFAPPDVDTVSTERTLRLARHLHKLDAKMYGAYWCSHCFDQKQAFGKQAAAMLNYVECAEDGVDSARGACRDRGINGYPTWDIGGKLYPGEHTIPELEAIAGLPPWDKSN